MHRLKVAVILNATFKPGLKILSTSFHAGRPTSKWTAILYSTAENDWYEEPPLQEDFCRSILPQFSSFSKVSFPFHPPGSGASAPASVTRPSLDIDA